ncbi:hypothetical protein QQS21_008400 [Conoideocrella luteorostrata]|uniref:Uncharacterized protein n=1 Tax=Conoideocrella luteorostrata TaxID=1105319 RepID=A0AAJ0FYP7_9HYPO|nr:hypothetical protein QQS21_008400 [Conoideocrella luteorostrata]
MAAMDEASIQIACMADLGRQRQEELPLSGKEGKRPSYAPTGRNGVGHYNPVLKRGLEKAWNVQIQDEESAQMQGLAVDDSRPWAKITKDYLHNHQAATAPPIIRQESQGRKRLKSEKSAGVASFGKLGGLVPPGGAAIRHPPSNPASKPIQMTAKSGESQSQNGHVDRVVDTNLPATSSAPQASFPIQPAKQLASEQVVHKGLCKLLDPRNMLPLFIINYSLKILNDSSKALIVLSAERGDKIHDVLDAKTPEFKDDRCRICSKAKDNGWAYILQFNNAPDAKKFCLFMENLQKAAARTLGRSSIANKPATTPITTSINTPATTSTTTPATQSLEPPTLTSSSASASMPYVVPSTTTASTKAVTVSNGDRETPKLVDVESPPREMQGAKMPTIEDAAEKLFGLIEDILPEAAAAGLNISDDAISDIQETAINSWLTRGFLKSESDDMKSELLDLLRILVRIKHKAERRKQENRIKPIIKSLDGFHISEVKPSRIKYSSSEIESWAKSGVSPPTGLDKAIVTPRKSRSVTGYSAAAAATGVSKHKSWLSSKPQQHSIEIETPPLSAEKPNDVMRSVNVSSTALGISPPVTPCNPTPKGLGTSRWACG